MIIEFIVPERPERSRASLDVLQGLALIYLEGEKREIARVQLASGVVDKIATACTSIGGGVVRSYHGEDIDRKQAIKEYLRLGLDFRKIPWPLPIALGPQYRGH